MVIVVIAKQEYVSYVEKWDIWHAIVPQGRMSRGQQGMLLMSATETPSTQLFYAEECSFSWQTPREQQRQKAIEKVFAITKEDVAASNAVVAGNISIASQCAYALFDPDSMHSFISIEFAKNLDMLPKPLVYELCVGTPIRDFHATVDYLSKKVVFRLPNQPEFSFLRSCKGTFPRLISALQARKLLKKGCCGYLAYIEDTSKVELKMKNVLVAIEFLDVFPEDLPDLPLDREIEFCIDLMPSTAPISKAPYCMHLLN